MTFSSAKLPWSCGCFPAIPALKVRQLSGKNILLTFNKTNITLTLACSKPFNSHQGHPSNRFWKRSLNVEMEKAFQQWLWGSSKFDTKRKWLAPKEITLRPVVVFQTSRVTNEKCMGQIVCKGRSAQKYQLGQAFRGGRVQKQAWEHPCRADRFLCSPHVPALLTKVKGPIRKLV